MEQGKKVCAIMQPTYLPWAGYFNLIARADVFIFLDDVQFSTGDKTSWQNRNRIILQGKAYTLTVPAMRSHLGQSLMEIQVDDKQNWRKKHLQTLRQVYSKHPYGSEMLSIVEPVLLSTKTILPELTIDLILGFCKILGLAPEFHRSSSLAIKGERTERLVNFCKFFECQEYFSPAGSREYIAEDGNFNESNISLRFQEFIPDPYSQKGVTEFVSHLSIVDILASLGPDETSRYVRQE